MTPEKRQLAYQAEKLPGIALAAKDRRRNKTGRDAKGFFFGPRRNAAKWSEIYEQDSNAGSEEKIEQIDRNFLAAPVQP
ncbi:MAG: hypothetical protein AAGJ31_13065, partial [Verrucomicrobiota bacterium]